MLSISNERIRCFLKTNFSLILIMFFLSSGSKSLSYSKILASIRPYLNNLFLFLRTFKAVVSFSL